MSRRALGGRVIPRHGDILPRKHPPWCTFLREWRCPRGSVSRTLPMANLSELAAAFHPASESAHSSFCHGRCWNHSRTEVSLFSPQVPLPYQGFQPDFCCFKPRHQTVDHVEAPLTLQSDKFLAPVPLVFVLLRGEVFFCEGAGKKVVLTVLAAETQLGADKLQSFFRALSSREPKPYLEIGVQRPHGGLIGGANPFLQLPAAFVGDLV